MKVQGPIIAGGLAVAAVLYYLWSKNKAQPAAAPRPQNSPGGASFLPTQAVATPISGAPVPSLSTSLALQGTNLLTSLLGQAIKTNLGGSSSSSPSSSNSGLKLGAGGGGGGGGGGSKTSSSSPTDNSNAGGVNPDNYYTDPGTGITYDVNTGNAVSGMSVSPGVVYTPPETPVSVDIPDTGTPVDTSSGSFDYSSTDFSGGDFSGGDFSGG